MNITTSQSKLLETRFVWGPTLASTMEMAQSLEFRGWRIQGNPAPMFYNGVPGTGVAVTREVVDG